MFHQKRLDNSYTLPRIILGLCQLLSDYVQVSRVILQIKLCLFICENLHVTPMRQTAFNH